MRHYSAISTPMVEWVSWFGLVLLSSPSCEMMVGRLVNQRDTISHTVADCLCHVQHLQSRADNKYGLLLDWSVYWSLFSSKTNNKSQTDKINMACWIGQFTSHCFHQKQTTRGKTDKTRFDMRYMG